MSDNDMIENTQAGRAATAQAERAAAELQRDAAVAEATIQHVQREEAVTDSAVAMNVAANSVAERDVVAAVADVEARRRRQAEDQAINARMSANQARHAAAQYATERNVLRENLAEERAASSNTNFGLMLLTCIGLVAVIGFGIWYFSTQNAATNAVNSVQTSPQVVSTGASAAPNRAATVQTPAPSAAARPDVHINIINPPAAPAAAPAAESSLGTPSGTVGAIRTTAGNNAGGTSASGAVTTDTGGTGTADTSGSGASASGGTTGNNGAGVGSAGDAGTTGAGR